MRSYSPIVYLTEASKADGQMLQAIDPATIEATSTLIDLQSHEGSGCVRL